MTFDEVLGFLEERREAKMRLELKPTQDMLEALGRPDRSLSSIVVAGTNGKGSTCAFLTAMAAAAGLRVGTYTSPHVESVTERIALGGAPAPARLFAASAGELLSRLPETLKSSMSYFEFLTLVAVLLFGRQRVDLAIFEVGLGGRLDATNALERIATVITSVDYDHTAVLGPTLPRIAAEKAAVMRADLPCIIGRQEDEALGTLLEIAAATGAKAVVAGHDFHGTGGAESFRFEGLGSRLGPLRLGLRAGVQSENAAAAAATALSLKERFPFTPASLEAGLRRADLPARMERWVSPSGAEVWLDIGHNPEAAASVATYVKEEIRKPVDLIIGILEDKDWRRMLSALAPLCRTVVLTRPRSPRAWDPLRAKEFLSGTASARVIPDPASAMEEALGGSDRVVCTGSTYTVGAIRPWLRERGFERSVG